MATAKEKIRRRPEGIILLVFGVIMTTFFGFLTYAFATGGWGLGPGGILLTIVGVIVAIIGMVFLAGKYIYMIGGICIFVFGLIIIIFSGSFLFTLNPQDIGVAPSWYTTLFAFILGLVYVVIGLVSLITSRKNYLIYDIKSRIVGIIILVVGLTSIIFGSLGMYTLLDFATRHLLFIAFFPFIFGVILSLIGVCILLISRKENSAGKFRGLPKDADQVLNKIKEVLEMDSNQKKKQKSISFLFLEMRVNKEFQYLSDSEYLDIVKATYKLNPQLFVESIYPKMRDWRFPFLSIEEEKALKEKLFKRIETLME
ncbi:MAG: hypothetical protein ACFFCG_09075 [Promethearchaeota archaeon]